MHQLPSTRDLGGREQSSKLLLVQLGLFGGIRRELPSVRGGPILASGPGGKCHVLWHMLMLPLLLGVIGHDLGRAGILQQQ